MVGCYEDREGDEVTSGGPIPLDPDKPMELVTSELGCAPPLQSVCPLSSVAKGFHLWHVHAHYTPKANCLLG